MKFTILASTGPLAITPELQTRCRTCREVPPEGALMLVTEDRNVGLCLGCLKSMNDALADRIEAERVYEEPEVA